MTFEERVKQALGQMMYIQLSQQQIIEDQQAKLKATTEKKDDSMERGNAGGN